MSEIIPYEAIIEHPNWPWDWVIISRYTTFEFFNEHRDLPWNYYDLSKNMNIPIDFILENREINWYIVGICGRSDFLLSMTSIIEPNYYGLSSNPNITLDYVEQHINEDWFWLCLSENPGITPAQILSTNHTWFWNRFSRHPNLTAEIVLSNPDRIWNRNTIQERFNITL